LTRRLERLSPWRSGRFRKLRKCVAEAERGPFASEEDVDPTIKKWKLKQG
jgi:hypothetical protein